MRRGQSTIEWMLIVSVLAIGLAVAAYAFIPGFQSGVKGLGIDIDTLFAAGETNGSGNMR